LHRCSLGASDIDTKPAEDEPPREIRLRLARSQTIQWLATLGSHHSVEAEQACRGLADRYRLDAARQRNPILKAFAIESADKFAGMAEQLKRGREGSC
jgi:hypothetical protein